MEARAFVVGKPTAGGKLLNPAVGSPGVGEIAELEVKFKRLFVDLKVETSSLQTFDFAAKIYSLRTDSVVEWLFAEAVPGEEELAAAAVPNGVSKHATEFSSALRSVLLIEMENRFGIALGSEAVALILK
jgi:hypothetical protein